MTIREAAIVGAYTGVLLGKFSDMQAYIEEIMCRSVWTHELGDKNTVAEVKEKAKPDFLNLCINGR